MILALVPMEEGGTFTSLEEWGGAWVEDDNALVF